MNPQQCAFCKNDVLENAKFCSHCGRQCLYQENKLAKAEFGKMESESSFSDSFSRIINDAFGPLTSGKRCFNMHDLDRAIFHFNKEIARHSDCIEAYKYRAAAYNLKAEYNMMLKDCIKIVELLPADKEAYKECAYSYRLNHSFKESLLFYGKAIDLGDDSCELYISRGCCFSENGEFDNAILDLNRAIAIKPIHIWGIYWRGVCYSEMGDFTKAMEDFRVVRKNPNNNSLTEFYCNYAESFYKKEYDKCHEYEQKIRSQLRINQLKWIEAEILKFTELLKKGIKNDYCEYGIFKLRCHY